MNRKRYVILEGGFGNQLWQLAFAHKLASYGKVVLVKIIHESQVNSVTGQSLELAKVLKQCKHDIELREVRFEKMTTRARFNSESNYNFNKKSIIDFRHSSWRDMLNTDFSKAKKVLGFFQSTHLLEEQIDVVLNELIETLKGQGSRTELENGKSKIFIHMRGGDYFNPKHIDKFGVLSRDYYSRLFEAVPPEACSNAMVFTNDIGYARGCLPSKPNIKILGPDAINSWDCFLLMMGCDIACIANSSFSWWSGMVVKKKGGRMIVPFPWFKGERDSLDGYSDIYDAGMEKFDAIFL